MVWSTLSGDGARTATRAAAVPSLTSPRWVVSTTPLGEPIHFVGPASVAATVLGVPRVFVVGRVAGQARAFAVDAETGALAWMTPLPSLVLDSWSSPALDEHAGTVLFAAGSSIIALRCSDGSEAWRTDLPSPPVNVSPVVTQDLGPRNRAFVTDYGGFGGPSSLYCINVSPRHATMNPHDPGDVVWTVPIGSANGATPAYCDGVVYVSSTGLDASGFGEVRAFDATAPQPAPPLWTFVNPIMEGFFAGVAVRESAVGTFVYAASYAFYGGVTSANLVKLDAATGSLVWSVPANRTSSLPIVLRDGRIVLSSGLQGFGSAPMVQLFRDDATTATQLWNTAESTWNDLNQNGSLDVGEFLALGGWTMHPILIDSYTPALSPRLLVGAPPTTGGTFGAYTHLVELDLTKSPNQPGFVVQQSTVGGSSPAMLGSAIYSIGPTGLAALGPPPPRPDVAPNARVDLDDLYAWERGQGFRDVDRSGVVDLADRAVLLTELRRNEARGMRPRGGTP